MLNLPKMFKAPMIKSHSQLDYDFIVPNEAFQNAIKCERARSNRTNQHFTIIVFSVSKKNGDLKNLDSLVQFLSTRVRMTDTIGWFDDTSIGVILSNTTSDGACKFLKEIGSRSDTNIKLPSFTTYEYPSNI